ncbi:hypothetical protein LXL04_022530 [Taraxacum kok-saghyz]
MRVGFITTKAVAVVLVLVVVAQTVESAIGVNWGTISNHRLAPSTVVDLLRDNKIQKVKLFDADPDCLRALMGTGIEVMMGVSNDLLATLSSSTAAADLWVSQNVSTYMVRGGANINCNCSVCRPTDLTDYNWDLAESEFVEGGD